MLRRTRCWSSPLQAFYPAVPPTSDALGLDDCRTILVDQAQKDPDKSIHIIRGPPGGGKSTLAMACLRNKSLFDRPTEFFCAVSEAFRRYEENPSWFLSNTAIIDDCQQLLDPLYQGLINHLKNEPVFAVLCGTMPIEGPTPFPQAKRQNYFLNGLFADRPATERWFSSRLDLLQLPWLKDDQKKQQFVSLATATTSAHVGLLQMVGRRLEKDRPEDFGSEATTVKFIIEAMKQHRLLARNGVNKYDGLGRSSVIGEVLACGSTPCLLEAPSTSSRLQDVASDNRKAVDGGLFFPTSMLRSQPGLVAFDDLEDVSVSLAHPTQWEFSEPHLKAKPSLPKTTVDTPSTLVDLLLAVAPCFQWQSYVDVQFTNNAQLAPNESYDNGTGSVTESLFRSQIFNPTASSIFGDKLHIASEVVPAKDKRVKLDNVYTFGATSIGVEFLNCHRGFDDTFNGLRPGSKVPQPISFAQDFANHHIRWNARYSPLADKCTDYGTVGIVGPSGFVTKAQIAKIHAECVRLKCRDHPWAVVCVSGHSEATIFHGRTIADMKNPLQVDVVRNGVPQKLGDGGDVAVPARHLAGLSAFAMSLKAGTSDPPPIPEIWIVAIPQGGDPSKASTDPAVKVPTYVQATTVSELKTWIFQNREMAELNLGKGPYKIWKPKQGTEEEWEELKDDAHEQTRLEPTSKRPYHVSA